MHRLPRPAAAALAAGFALAMAPSDAAAQARRGLDPTVAAVLEEEMNLLKGTIESNFKLITELKARVDALEKGRADAQKAAADAKARAEALAQENAALRARVEAIEKARAAADAKAAEELAARSLLGGMLSFDAAARVRFESVANQRDLDGDLEDQETFVAHRIRAGLHFRPVPTADLYIQIQDARRWGREADTLADDEGIGLHQGYVRFDDLLSDGIFLQAGRFEMAYGSERLIGDSDFDAAGRSFDAIRLGYHRQGVVNLDAFVAKIADRATVLDRDRDLYGVWLSTDAVEGATFEVYTLLSNDNAAASEETVGTVGARVALDMDFGLFGDAEAAIQFGDRRGVDVLATMYAAELGYRMESGPAPFDASFFFYAASGDGNPDDDRDVDFDPLFPSRHMHYGRLEQVSLRNLTGFGPRVSVGFLDELRFAAELHSQWLVTPFGTRFGLGEGRATADELTHLGEELDLSLRWDPWDFATATVGYSFFIPDRDAAGLRGEDRVDWVWLQLEARY